MTKYFSTLLLFVLCIQINAQMKMDSLLIEGNYRSFYFKEPAGISKNKSIIFIMHGSGGNGTNMMEPSKALQEIAASQGYFLVYPNGYKNYWNECRLHAKSTANKENINEQAFFEAMLKYFHKKYKTTEKQFFAIGLSGGGHMAYKLAMTMPEKCKAITAIVASLPGTDNMDCEGKNKAVAVMIANGTKDGLNKYNGGDIIINNENYGSIRGTDSTFHYWANLAGYNGDPVTEELPDPDVNNGQTITKLTYKEKNKPAVILLRVNGGEHTFPKDVNIFLNAASFFTEEQKRLRKK